MTAWASSRNQSVIDEREITWIALRSCALLRRMESIIAWLWIAACLPRKIMPWDHARFFWPQAQQSFCVVIWASKLRCIGLAYWHTACRPKTITEWWQCSAVCLLLRTPHDLIACCLSTMQRVTPSSHTCTLFHDWWWSRSMHFDFFSIVTLQAVKASSWIFVSLFIDITRLLLVSWFLAASHMNLSSWFSFFS